MLEPNETLRPMRMIDMLDLSLRLYRNHFGLFIAIAAIVAIPAYILQTGLLLAITASYTSGVKGMGEVQANARQLATIQFASLLGSYFVFVISTVGEGAFANALSQIMKQEPLSVFKAYTFGMGRILGLLGIGLIANAPYLFLAGMLAGNISPIGPCIGFLLLIAALVFGLTIVPRLFVSSQAYVIERTSWIQAFRRSWVLTYGVFGRVFGFILLTGLFAFILSLVIQIPFVIGTMTILDEQREPVLFNAIGNIGALLAQIFVTFPIQFTMVALFYRDLRIRKEALDLEMRTEQL